MSASSASPAESPIIPDHAAPAERLAACKAYLQAETAALRARHAAGASGLEIVRTRAAFMDRMVRELFEHAMPN